MPITRSLISTAFCWLLRAWGGGGLSLPGGTAPHPVCLAHEPPQQLGLFTFGRSFYFYFAQRQQKSGQNPAAVTMDVDSLL